MGPSFVWPVPTGMFDVERGGSLFPRQMTLGVISGQVGILLARAAESDKASSEAEWVSFHPLQLCSL